MKTVRWGLLSTARINRRVIPPIRASRRGELVAVASRQKETAEAYAAEWDIPHTFGSYDAMLASDLVDAVYVALPNHLHAEWSIKAMQAGKHVLCEKPLALSVAEVDRMIQASQETGQVLAEAFMYRHHPQTKIAGEWAHQGRLGEISLVRGVFNFSIGHRGRDQSSPNIRLVPEYGGGSLWDVGVYPVSFAQFILGGPPEWVSGAQWTGATGVDETFAGQLSYSGDRLAQVACSLRTPFYTFAEVLGAQGRLVLDQPFIWNEGHPRLFFVPPDGEPEEIPVPEEPLYQGEIEDMHAAILDGAPPYLSLTESRSHIQTVQALYASARHKESVEIV